MSAVLVTGGSGFLGGHLVAMLCARGEQVRVLDLMPPDDFHGAVEFVCGSILDVAALRRAMTDVRRVYHLAGIAKLWAPNKADFDAVNWHGTEAVLQAAEKAGVARVVHCSTEAILLPKARTGAPIDEAAPPSYDDLPGPYTRSKHRAEGAALAAAQRGLHVAIVNPTVPIGPNDRNLTPPAAMLAMFLSGSSPGFLDCILNLVDVRDVAAGMMLAAERGRSGERYILGGENISLRDLLLRIEKISGHPMPKRAVPAPIAMASAIVVEWIANWVTERPPVATREGVRLALRTAPFDSRKAREELGFAARPIEDALDQAVRWLSAKTAP